MTTSKRKRRRKACCQNDDEDCPMLLVLQTELKMSGVPHFLQHALPDDENGAFLHAKYMHVCTMCVTHMHACLRYYKLKRERAHFLSRPLLLWCPMLMSVPKRLRYWSQMKALFLLRDSNRNFEDVIKSRKIEGKIFGSKPQEKRFDGNAWQKIFQKKEEKFFSEIGGPKPDGIDGKLSRQFFRKMILF